MNGVAQGWRCGLLARIFRGGAEQRCSLIVIRADGNDSRIDQRASPEARKAVDDFGRFGQGGGGACSLLAQQGAFRSIGEGDACAEA